MRGTADLTIKLFLVFYSIANTNVPCGYIVLDGLFCLVFF